MTRTTRTAARRGAIDEEDTDTDSKMPPSNSKMPSANSYDIPQRSSRAPSLADVEAPSSGSTIRNDDVHMDFGEPATANDDMQTFGERSRQLIKVIQKLEGLGINKALPSLPKFVVVGDQSHGKSSIIEAICDISLPRSSGTCTRCPFRITTTSPGPADAVTWSCKISLTRKWQFNKRSRDWKDNGAPPLHFATVTDRQDLERVLRLAQVAVLNPMLDPYEVLHSTLTEYGVGIGFSANSINLHISGSNLPELSMFDLPGSINVAPNEDEQHLVGFIEKLIKTYVKDTKALILLVASMDQDLETSTAFRFVRDSQALGRSIGVLTKPDLLSKGRLEHVRRILNSDVFKLGHSWFVTKNLSQEQLDDDTNHTSARQREEQFFDETVPWCSNLLDYAGRFGTAKLQDTISHLLVAHIESELPDIIALVEARLDEVSSELDRMPERPTLPSQTVMEEIQSLVKQVTQFLAGNDEDAAFRTKFKALLRWYRAQLQSARPQLLLGTPGYVKPVVSLDSDDDTMSDAPTPSKRQKANVRSTPASTPTRSDASAGRVKDESGVLSAQKAVFKLDRIQQALDQAKNSDMPDQVDPKVVDRFIRQSMAPWQALTNSLMDQVQTVVGKVLVHCITESLDARKDTELTKRVTESVETFAEHVHEDGVKSINHVVACELHKPISWACSLKQQTDDVRAKLQASRLTERINEYYDTLEADKNVKVPIGEKRKEKAKDLDFVTKALGSDKYTSEVSAMASPLAYYDLAAGRLLDTVANHLELDVVHEIEMKLQVRLTLELHVNDPEYCARLLAENPGREAERQRLVAEREKLLKAMDELKGLPGQH